MYFEFFDKTLHIRASCINHNIVLQQARFVKPNNKVSHLVNCTREHVYVRAISNTQAG